MRLALTLAIGIATVALCGCGSQSYRDTQAGKFSGDLDVRWVRNDQFLFVPSAAKPFTFVRTNGRHIAPGPMYTDGGSIPRFLWGASGLSPWGYAPAYMVHDWLFEAKHCGYPADGNFTFEETAVVMAEGLKAIMDADAAVRDDFVFGAIVAGVRTPIARKIWDEGACKAPRAPMEFRDPEAGQLIMTIRFP